MSECYSIGVIARRAPSLRTLLLAVAATTVAAGEIGHFNPGVVNVRDYVMPAPGFYGALYNYVYTSDELTDGDGDARDTVTLPANRPRGRSGRTLRLDVDLDLYAMAPTLMWVADWTLLGVRYGAYIAPTFANTSLGAALATETGRGVNPSTSTFDVGDVYMQPLWLDWAQEHVDVAVGMGFYAPSGKYDVETLRVPVGRSRSLPTTVEAVDNVGFGFWTLQTQLAGAWYPWAHKATAVVLALTPGLHGEKRDFDLTPGQDLTFNWGVSQYVPLDAGATWLLELGVAGDDGWQVSHDSGRDAAQPNVLDQVHAAGGQIGVTQVPWALLVNVHAFQEFAADDRFQGVVVGLNVAKKF